MSVDPIAVAWRAVNPNVPLPQSLWRKDVDPEREEQRAETARQAKLDAQRRRRGSATGAQRHGPRRSNVTAPAA